MGVMVPAWMSAGLNVAMMRWPCSSNLRRVVPSGVIASEPDEHRGDDHQQRP
jgi:hypothetical protein